MKKRMDKGIISLSAFYFVYFIYMGFSTFVSKYLRGDLGFSSSQISILLNVPSLVAMCFMPFIGSLSDRMKSKKTLIIALNLLAAVCLFFVDSFTDFSAEHPVTRFYPLLGLLIVNACFLQPVMPTATAISIEYAESRGRSFGPIRMFGTIGYQIGALVVGFIFVGSLRYIYTYQAFGILAAVAVLFTIPDISGHQHGKTKQSPFAVLKDRRALLLLVMVLVATCSTMFYQTFFGAFYDDMHLGNKISSIITWVAVSLEIPMLFFSKKLVRWKSVWKWMIFGLAVNGVRWLGFALAFKMHSWLLLLLFQIPSVTATACFEIFPQLYLGETVAPELSSSAQTLLNFTSFGVAKVIGALLGGFISDMIGGLNVMFIIYGIILLIATAVFAPVCLKLDKADAKAD